MHAEFDRFDLSSLRTGIMAGSPCPIEVMNQVVERMHMDQVTICYGMTETSPVSTQTAMDDPLAKRVGTVGRVHPHVEVKIVDAAGHVVAPGEVADAEEIRSFCRDQIAHYKVPRYIRFVDGFPTTVTGKVQKFVMRERMIEELGLQAHPTA